MRLLLLICCAAMLLPLGVAAQVEATPEAPASLVTVDLLADTSQVRAGEPFTVGVLLHIVPGWHVYWSNPGDSGRATSVRFKLPAGFTAGPLQFPVPQRLEQPGQVVNFGYEGEVLLMARVTPPNDLPAGEAINLQADVKWLCCKDVCLPGSGKPTLSLQSAKAGDKARPANEPLFQNWQSQVPTPHPADVKQSEARIGTDGLASITTEWTKVPGDLQVFPGPSEALRISQAVTKAAGWTTTISTKVQRLAGLELASPKYPIVIGYTDSEGHRRGLLAEIPVDRLQAAPPQP